jgi:carbon-monoxide dehydrogenase medium subunit
MRPSKFAYHKAETLDAALGLLAEHGEDARPIAGGYSLVPMMNLRLAQPEHLIDINGLPLDSIKKAHDVLHIGALVRHERLLSDPLVIRHLPVVLQAAGHIGHPAIRKRGTIGGSLANADPAAELSVVAVLHDARLIAHSQAGERRIEAARFFEGAYTTALEPGELLTGIEFPVSRSRHAGCFLEHAERHGDFAIVAVGVYFEWHDNRITKAALACSGAEMTPVRGHDVERSLLGLRFDEIDAAEAAVRFADGLDPQEDIRASAEYRRHLLGALAQRAMETVRAGAGDAQ